MCGAAAMHTFFPEAFAPAGLMMKQGCGNLTLCDLKLHLLFVLLTVLLEKFKDKAAVVNKAATEALQSMARYCFALADVAEDIAAALAHQNPKVKESTLTWLTACVTRETKQAVSKLMPVVMPAAAKCTDDGSPAIREAAFGFLVQATLKVGQLMATAASIAPLCRPSCTRVVHDFSVILMWITPDISIPRLSGALCVLFLQAAA